MKIKSSLLIAGLCSLVGSFSSAAEPARPSTTPEPPAAKRPESPPTAPAAVDSSKRTEKASAPVKKETLPSLAESKAIETAKREHVRPENEQVKMDTPPPPARSEKKPAATSAGMVWVPGHWTPVKGEWYWVAGEWGVPATPVSVWIEASYDAKTKQWSPGYWQPDRLQPDETERSEKESAPPQKFL